MFPGRAMPAVAAAIFFPPPANFALRNPDPLAALVGPSAAFHCDGCEHESVFFAVISDAFAGYEARVADGFCDHQNPEVALRKVAKRVEVEHLPIEIEKRVLGVIGRGRLTDDHPGSVGALRADIRRHAAGASESPKVDHGVRDIGPGGADGN